MAANRAEYMRAYAKANSVKIAERQRLWREANREATRQKQKERYAIEREAVIARQRDWQRKNPERVRAAVYARREKVKQATPGWAASAEIRLAQMYAKAWSAATGVLHHVDHVVPLISPVVCGLHVWANFAIVPAVTNMAKTNKTWPHMPE